MATSGNCHRDHICFLSTLYVGHSYRICSVVILPMPHLHMLVRPILNLLKRWYLSLLWLVQSQKKTWLLAPSYWVCSRHHVSGGHGVLSPIYSSMSSLSPIWPPRSYVYLRSYSMLLHYSWILCYYRLTYWARGLWTSWKGKVQRILTGSMEFHQIWWLYYIFTITSVAKTIWFEHPNSKSIILCNSPEQIPHNN